MVAVLTYILSWEGEGHDIRSQCCHVVCLLSLMSRRFDSLIGDKFAATTYNGPNICVITDNWFIEEMCCVVFEQCWCVI
jgi:hypothetical protein